MKTVTILGVGVHDVSLQEICTRVQDLARAGRKSVVANVNAHAMNIAFSQSWFRDFLNSSDIVFCDGFGVLIAARFLGRPITHRVTYADLIWSLAEAVSQAHLTMFLLGARAGVPELAAERLTERFPDLQVVGTHHGYFDKRPGSLTNAEIVRTINACKPDILLVGFGMPDQERWIMENLASLEVKVAMPVGAAFDYAAGRLRRPPRWMTDYGFEWLGRLLLEPRRLWRRYLIGNPVFLSHILRERLGWPKYAPPPD